MRNLTPQIKKVAEPKHGYEVRTASPAVPTQCAESADAAESCCYFAAFACSVLRTPSPPCTMKSTGMCAGSPTRSCCCIALSTRAACPPFPVAERLQYTARVVNGVCLRVCAPPFLTAAVAPCKLQLSSRHLRPFLRRQPNICSEVNLSFS